MTPCKCAWRDRESDDEPQREWFKDCMCMFHWMQTDYYVTNAHLRRNILNDELLDLITLMPDSQTQEIIDYIMSLREIRGKNK